jgi:phospholipase C
VARLKLCLSALLLAGVAGFLFSLNGCGGGTGPTFNAVQHVIVIFQENRSTDNLFQDPVLIARGADIANVGVNSKGETIPLGEVDLASAFDLDHSHGAFVAMYDGGKMDGADRIGSVCDPGITNCGTPPNPQFMYVKPSQVQPYFQLAEQYTFGDRMFQTNQGPSFPAHQFIISGTSIPKVGSDLFVSGNPFAGKGGSNAGCMASPNSGVALVEPDGKEDVVEYPCFEHPVLSDLLDAKAITWRYYTPTAGSIWTGPNAIRHMCQPKTQGGQLVCTGGIWSKVIIPQTQVLKDIVNNQLAQVSWVIPDGYSSDHAGGNDGSGPSWVASIVDAIGNSSYWANTVILITWDDWGGWYDHVPPKIINSYEYGFRVPLIVVSPYAKPAYISHVTHDFGSILKFIEEKFGLGSLGYADALADDLSDCFDFNQTPTAFKTIPLPVSVQHFLDDPRPPTDPDDD